MDSVPGAYQSGPPSNPPAPIAADATPLLTWPRTVQLALGLIITAGIFFLLGRWSLEWSRPQPPAATFAHAVPTLNLNRATKAELRLLPGLGDALAQRVVDYRDEHGFFRNVNELRHVNGIGPKSLDRLRPWLFVAAEHRSALDDEYGIPAKAEKPQKMQRAAAMSTKKPLPAEPINVNSASLAELQKLPGIGPKMSQRILEARAKTPFKSVDDLRRVPGIGPKILEKLRHHVTLDTLRTAAAD